MSLTIEIVRFLSFLLRRSSFCLFFFLPSFFIYLFIILYKSSLIFLSMNWERKEVLTLENGCKIVEPGYVSVNDIDDVDNVSGVSFLD